ncbi:protogenin [Hyperolius riggenbachi]|uniref:protogenin n=1 Tax=Hyperolius riggenbachi TaxID=752182 RepID=UPI0035A31D6C
MLSLPGSSCFSDLLFVKEPSDTVVSRKDSVMLDCHAQGEPPISVTWMKNGVNIVESQRILTLQNGSLYIQEVEGRKGEQSDEGYYQCLVMNKCGAVLSQRAHLSLASMSAFEEQPASIRVREGGVARFSCKITANPPAVITWEVNRTALPLALDRITVLSKGVLQIYGVTKKDAGNYRCVATSISTRRKSAEAMLTVVPAALAQSFQRPVIIAPPHNTTVSMHQTVTLECVATGNPKPIVSWSRLDQKPIDVFNTRVLGNGNLVISNVKVQHAGVYNCRATTPGTRNFTVAMANLVVLAPPAFVERPESLTRPRAGTARFVCQVEGIPTPKISWLKNGIKIYSYGRTKINNGKLSITQISPEDDAVYQCMAENSCGSILSRARLTVVMPEDRPSAPRHLRAETMSSSAIILSWERPLYNSEKVIAYSVHYMKAEGLNNEEYQVVIGNDTDHHIIDDLDPASNYTFYIVAYMPMGASQMSEHITQSTLEDVPLRAPELSLTSRSPTDVLISWLPIPPKFCRGKIILYRLLFRMSTESSVQVLELPGTTHDYFLEGLKPDNVYLVRIAAATRVGWGESSAWTSHQTPKATSIRAPRSPELRLDPLNCTTIAVRWQQDPEDTATIQGYKLYYKEEGQKESGPILLDVKDFDYNIGGLDPRRKYQVRLLAYNNLDEGYQADQTVSTPVCVSVPDHIVPPPPPPHHLYAKANSSSSIYLYWGRPAFSSGQVINYTVRCNPVGLQNASLVLYLQTTEPHIFIQDLEKNTKYEIAVRLHVDQLSSPWSPVVYHSTLPEAPDGPPTGVKVTLIEETTALVSWKTPEDMDSTVTRYTILYTKKDCTTGDWHTMHRDGAITMALLENLLPGNVYLVKIAASNEVGEGPFSDPVELVVHLKETFLNGVKSKHFISDNGQDYSSFYHLDQKSMTGIVVGVCIALTCILICVLILIYRSRARRRASVAKIAQQENNRIPQSAAFISHDSQQRKSQGNEDPLITSVAVDHFIDAKGGSDLIINGYGPVGKEKTEKKWSFFKNNKTDNSKQSKRRIVKATCLYQPGTTVLLGEGTSPTSPGHPGTFQMRRSIAADTEHSGNSEESHETNDSGRYSHESNDEINLYSVVSTTPPTSDLFSSQEGEKEQALSKH